MKVKPSPLVAELNGSAAEFTAASWKGINYVRRKVTPANPNTQAQQDIRNALKRLVPLWRSLSTAIKSWLDTYGSHYQMSGFNVHSSKNIVLEKDGALLLPVPAHGRIPPPADPSILEGTNDGEIDVSWTDDSGDLYDEVVPLTRETDKNVYVVHTGILAATATGTLDGLTATTNHDVWLIPHNTTTGVFGTSTGALAVVSGTT